MNARRLTAEETRRLSDLETAAERAEEARDFRAAAIAWGEGRDLCRAAPPAARLSLFGSPVAFR